MCPAGMAAVILRPYFGVTLMGLRVRPKPFGRLIPDGTSARLLRGCVKNGLKRGRSLALQMAPEAPAVAGVVR
jgi:hypothetical protein